MPDGPGFGTFLGGCCCCKCYCSRCEDGTAPEYWTATILGTDYILHPFGEENNLQNCVYGHLPNLTDPNQLPEGTMIGCDIAGYILLSLTETIEDYRWILQIHGLDGTVLHAYEFVIPDFEPVDCQSFFILLKTGGSCGGSDTVTITPGPVGLECEDCDPAVSSGSTGGGGDPPILIAPSSCGCCDIIPQAWELNIPGPLWQNRVPTTAPPPENTCEHCDVQGSFHLPYLGGGFACTAVPPLVVPARLVKCRYGYTVDPWCSDYCGPVGQGPYQIPLNIFLTSSRDTGIHQPCDGDNSHRCAVTAIITISGGGGANHCGGGHVSKGNLASVTYRSLKSDVECNPIPLYITGSFAGTPDLIFGSNTGGRICIGHEEGFEPPPIIFATPIP